METIGNGVGLLVLPLAPWILRRTGIMTMISASIIVEALQFFLYVTIM